MKHAPIKWDEVRRKIQANEQALNESLGRNPARIQAVFHQRAIQLAKGNTETRRASAGSPALVFRLARERYAVELKELAEVLPFNGCTEVPGTAPEFLGVVNLRGEIRPVIDLGLVLSGKPCGDGGFVLILRRNAGLKVDEIENLREIHAEELADPTPGHFTRGIVSETLKLLDVETVLSGVFSRKES